MSINYKKLEPKSGKTQAIVFFIHGYGADGSDLLSIGEVLSEKLENTLFIAPDAPWSCAMSPTGFEWFPIPWMDGSSEEDTNRKLGEASTLMDRFVSDKLTETKLRSNNAYLFGFSQGTMLSLHFGPMRDQPLGGIIGCSGKIANIGALRAGVKSRPPTLLIHGDQDNVVDYSFLDETYAELKSLNFAVKKYTSRGVGHGISPDGLNEALMFLVKLIETRE